MAEAPILRVDALTRRLGDRAAINDMSFSVDAGEYVSLLGPSGSGKTVLPGMLAAKSGVIVNTASWLGQIGGVALVHCSAA